MAKLQNRQLEFENEVNRKFEQVFRIIERLDLPKTAFIDKKLLERIKGITDLAIRRELNPVLKKSEGFDSFKAIENVITTLTSILARV